MNEKGQLMVEIDENAYAWSVRRFGSREDFKHMLCPVCNCDCFSMYGVSVVGSASVVSVTDDCHVTVDPLAIPNVARGTAVLVDCVCEEGPHRFRLRLQFHKGCVLTSWSYDGDGYPDVSSLWRD